MIGSTLSGNSARRQRRRPLCHSIRRLPFVTAPSRSTRPALGAAEHLSSAVRWRSITRFWLPIPPTFGPDLTGLIGTTFDVRFSLIGNNAHSGLAATPNRLPDANGNLIGPVVSAEPLWSYLEMAAMGDFEAGPDGDSFLFEYSVDGGAFQPLFTSSVDEAGSQTYFMDNRGTQVVLDDPLSVNGVLLNNDFPNDFGRDS